VTKRARNWSDHGFRQWVVEIRRRGRIHWRCRLSHVRFALPFAPAVEAAWRLARPYWGKGYAKEAARAAIDDGFSRLGLAGIVAFTVTSNQGVAGALMETARHGFADPTEGFSISIIRGFLRAIRCRRHVPLSDPAMTISWCGHGQTSGTARGAIRAGADSPLTDEGGPPRRGSGAGCAKLPESRRRADRREPVGRARRNRERSSPIAWVYTAPLASTIGLREISLAPGTGFDRREIPVSPSRVWNTQVRTSTHTLRGPGLAAVEPVPGAERNFTAADRRGAAGAV